MFQTCFKCFKHVANVHNTTFIIFKTRFKCFKRVANIQNTTFIIFKTRFKCFKRVLNVANVLQMFQKRCKCFKHVVNVSTALYLQRIANSRNKIIQGKCQPPYPETHLAVSFPRIPYSRHSQNTEHYTCKLVHTSVPSVSLYILIQDIKSEYDFILFSVLSLVLDILLVK